VPVGFSERANLDATMGRDRVVVEQCLGFFHARSFDQHHTADDFLSFAVGTIDGAYFHRATTINHPLGADFGQGRGKEKVAAGAQLSVVLDGGVVDAPHFPSGDIGEGVGGKVEKAEKLYIQSPWLKPRRRMLANPLD
jgi:hypothetical protein